MMIQDALFHLHEEVSRDANLRPKTLGGHALFLDYLCQILMM
jgi:hypothetical protein